MNRQRGKVAGFSLIETLLASTVGFVVIAAASGMIVEGITGAKTVGDIYQVNHSSRTAMQWLGKDIKEACEIPTQVSINATLYQADADTLILRMNSNPDYIVYDLVPDGQDAQGNNLYRMARTYIDSAGNTSVRVVAKNLASPAQQGANPIFTLLDDRVNVNLTGLRRGIATVAHGVDTYKRSMSCEFKRRND